LNSARACAGRRRLEAGDLSLADFDRFAIDAGGVAGASTAATERAEPWPDI
jgi:hypothetical protein